MKLAYFFGEAFANLRRNTLMTLAAMSTVTVSLFLLGSVMLGGAIITQSTGRWEGEVELNVFLRDEITPEQSKELETLISAMPEVQQVIYESKEAAFKEFQEMFKESPALTENVDPTALPASYRIKLHNPNTAPAVHSRLIGRPGVEDVNYGGESIKRLLKVTGLMKTVSLVFVGLLLAAATVLIANTIRIAVYARRNEIGIMKLVGASNWFIRVPFILEGIAEAVAGTMLAGVVIVTAKLLFLDRLQQSIPFLPLTVGWPTVLQIFGTLLAVGTLIGAIGSGFALRKFLEV